MKKNAELNSKITLVESMIGIFAFDEQNRVVDIVFFPKTVEKIVQAITKLQRGEQVEEVINLINRLVNNGYRDFIFENENLVKSIEAIPGVKIFVEKPSKAGEYLRSNLGILAVKKGFITELEEYYTLVHDVSTAIVRMGVKEASGKKDLLVSQAIFVLDDLDKTFNLFANRLREWYGFYFPELGGHIENSTTYVQLIALLGERHRFDVERLTAMGFNIQRAETMSTIAKNSMGADLSESDLKEIRSFSHALLEFYALREKTEHYLDDLMRKIAPNTRELVGSILGARLIATGGGLSSLSKKSSGTIQILGAEKALFRSLTTKSRPPKHGLIFQHKDIHQSPKWQRGKIARALAGKLAIAIRLDEYGGAYKGEELRAEYEKRVKEIKTKYAEPVQKGK